MPFPARPIPDLTPADEARFWSKVDAPTVGASPHAPPDPPGGGRVSTPLAHRPAPARATHSTNENGERP